MHVVVVVVFVVVFDAVVALKQKSTKQKQANYMRHPFHFETRCILQYSTSQLLLQNTVVIDKHRKPFESEQHFGTKVPSHKNGIVIPYSVFEGRKGVEDAILKSTVENLQIGFVIMLRNTS